MLQLLSLSTCVRYTINWYCSINRLSRHNINEWSMLIMLSIYGYMFYLWSVYYAYQLNPVYAIIQYMLSIPTTYCTYYQLLMYATRGIDLWYMLWFDNASWVSYRSIMHDRYSITEWCMVVMLSIYDTRSTSYRSIMHSKNA